MSTLLIFGSGECDQLGLGEDAPLEVMRPRKIPYFNGTPERLIYKVICGGLHTVALSIYGKIFTWGCNDDGALGREGPENLPMQVDESLSTPMSHISAGDSHTIAYNPTFNVVYMWGRYRNSVSGNFMDIIKKPQLIGNEEFNGKQVIKVVCGANHTLALADNTLYAWGDPESGQLGRRPSIRRKEKQCLLIEPVLRHVRDVFSGSYHSFLIKENGRVYSWGLNNMGQLGIDSLENQVEPTEIQFFRGINVVDIVSGEHHSIALTDEGKVYGWGKNDEGQLGISSERPQDPKEEEENEVTIHKEEQKEDKNEAVPMDITNHEIRVMPKDDTKVEPIKDTKEEEIKIEKIKDENPVKKVLEDKAHFKTPQYIQTIQEKVLKVAASSEHSYALTEDNKIYSWGMGERYVLCNRSEDNEMMPHQVAEELYKSYPILGIACGAQHIVFSIIDAACTRTAEEFKLEAEVFDPNNCHADRIRLKGERKKQTLIKTSTLSKGKKAEINSPEGSKSAPKNEKEPQTEKKHKKTTVTRKIMSEKKATKKIVKETPSKTEEEEDDDELGVPKLPKNKKRASKAGVLKQAVKRMKINKD